MSSTLASNILLQNTRLNNIAKLADNSFLERYLLLCHNRKRFRTLLTSQRDEYPGSGGRDKLTPLSNLFTNGCSPTGAPSTGSWPVEIADLKVLTEEYIMPWCIHFKIWTVSAPTGSGPLCTHQRSQRDHADWYLQTLPSVQAWDFPSFPVIRHAMWDKEPCVIKWWGFPSGSRIRLWRWGSCFGKSKKKFQKNCKPHLGLAYQARHHVWLLTLALGR